MIDPQNRPGPVQAAQTNQTKKPKGCFYYGCLSAVILGVLTAGILGFAAYKIYSKARAAIMDYSDTSPREIPEVPSTPEEYGQIKSRLNSFTSDLREGKAGTLVLSAKEINILIDREPELEFAKKHIVVNIESDVVTAEVSIPLEKLSMPDRYVNGSASFNITVQNGELLVTVKDFEVKGQTLPEELMSHLRSANLASSDKLSSESREILQRLESVTVRNGTITFKARAKK